MYENRVTRTVSICLFMLAVSSQVSLAAFVNCDAPRPNATSVLYLYYPQTDDSDFPEFGVATVSTSPCQDFDVNELDSSIDEAALIARITQLSRRHYCEFNVRIVQSRTANGTTNPVPSDTRWQVVGLGSDSETYGTGNLFGQAQAVDLDDADAQDFARVWAGSFGAAYGGAGGALNGTNSTLERWANAIAGTTSHEAGHNYGLSHSDSTAAPGEDGTNNHVMATGSTGLTGEQRTQFRHFSNTSFEVLAANLGLIEKTLTNWDFTNPNSSTADGFYIIVLVLPADGTPSKTSMYTGSLSPWGDVSISADTIPQETHQGTLYNRFRIEFTSPKAWANGPDGEVPAGEDLHVGVSIDKNNIVRDTQFTSAGVPLPLKPRFPGYDASSTFDPLTGALHISLFSFDYEENGELLLSPARVVRLPRTLPVDQMIAGGQLVDSDGVPIQPWQDAVRGQPTVLTTRAELTVGYLSEGRIVEILAPHNPNCVPGWTLGDGEGVSIEYCPEGTQVSLFPSARIYVEMTVTDPDALFYNRITGQMEIGALDTVLYFQVPGQKPDFNRNGIDDGIEILEGTLADDNNDGVPDDFVPDIPTVSEWGLIILVLLVMVTGSVALRRSRDVVTD